MSIARTRTELSISVEEAAALEQWLAREALAPMIAQRARIILLCGAGRSNAAVAREIGVREHTVGLWRRRFMERRLAGLLDQPRPGAPKRIDPEDARRRLTSILIQRPAHGREWTIRRLAEVSGLSPATVHRTWKVLFTRAHHEADAMPPADRERLERTLDIAGLHVTAQRGALVLALEEPRPQGYGGERGGHARRRAARRMHVSPAAALAFGALARSMSSARAPAREEGDPLRAFVASVERRMGPSLHVIASVPRESTACKGAHGAGRARGVVVAERAAWLELVERWLAVLALKHATDATCASLGALTEALRRALAQEPPRSCAVFSWLASPRGRTHAWRDQDEVEERT